MPYSNSNTLNVFLSYASEDNKIAEALARTFRAAFVNAIDITMMGEFPGGLNWRRLIDESIVRTDVLIAIASGRLKPSFSFTGFEIGSFSMSVRSQPKMAKFKNEDRRMIPFAVLARVPDVMNEFEGIDIDPTNLHDVRFDAKNIAEELNSLFKKDNRNSPDGKIYKLLCDVENIIIRVSGAGVAIDRTEERAQLLRGHARSLCKEIFENMLNREESVIQPKSKLIINLPPGWQHANKYELVEGASLRVEGPCYDAFGLRDGRGGKIYEWKEFTSGIDDDIVFAWREALASLITSSQESGFIENNIILAFNRKKIFRIFVSRITSFYSDAAEFHIYIIEILRRKDYGDPATTILLKAMEVGLVYRFMFLEDRSDFSKAMIMATPPRDLQRRVLDMVNGLSLLLQTTEEYGLNDPRTIIDIMGLDASQRLDDLYKDWETEKAKLYAAAKSILKMKQCTSEDKKGFVEVLDSFCGHTREVNRNYTTAVLRLLREKIETDKPSR